MKKAVSGMCRTPPFDRRSSHVAECADGVLLEADDVVEHPLVDLDVAGATVRAGLRLDGAGGPDEAAAPVATGVSAVSHSVRHSLLALVHWPLLARGLVPHAFRVMSGR